MEDKFLEKCEILKRNVIFSPRKNDRSNTTNGCRNKWTIENESKNKMDKMVYRK
jgi:hypothetical protein